ncbi:unnamed protein product [Fraxinus pennsylvanica]|uniref:Helicase C-terminal domain-containing protein n=1 Tax=Fraxinus pennsylvanica TaxID=56036 RepID=A0AAD2DV08_9LAMI|nr:unnamed protein product [Fraxinus pennsylvanica]
MSRGVMIEEVTCPFSRVETLSSSIMLELLPSLDCASRTSSSGSSVGASFSESLPGTANESPDLSGCSNSLVKDSTNQYMRLDGTMSVGARDNAVKDFNTNPEVTVMIMSLKATSLGLNMVAACHVLLLDLWWNPTTEDQAIDRAHRIGQTRPVSVLRLTVKDTVEDRILALQQKKRVMVSSAFGEDETGSRQTRLTVDDLKYLFMAD